MKSNFSNLSNSPECYETHPPLPLKIKGKEVFIYGGSCIEPAAKADVYVSLDDRSFVYAWEAPWVKQKDTNQEFIKKEHIRFPIQDFFVPEDIDSFNECLDYTIAKLENEQSVHVGCGSGHGRTGLFLAALTQKIHEINLQWDKANNLSAQTKPTPKENKNSKDSFSAIDYVREQYCSKAIETLTQILFLNKFYGIKIPKEEEGIFFKIDQMFKTEFGVSLEEVMQTEDFASYASTVDGMEYDLIQMELTTFKSSQSVKKKPKKVKVK